MIVSLLSFFYISIICLGTGMLANFCFNKVFKKTLGFSVMSLIAAGIVVITVFAEYFSIVSKIGPVPHIIMIILAFAGYFLEKKRISMILSDAKKLLFSWEGLFYVGFALVIAFFTSRGVFHTDTNIYHAQAIRLYEEYGLIKGMGNLQLHYAYNSSSLAFASIFSLNWLFGQSIHTTTGFYELIFSIYSFYGLKRIKSHKLHIADAIRVALLFYVLVILSGSMSPATDYVTMMFVLYVILRFCENMEDGRDTDIYALLSVLSVFVVSLKFSAALLVLIVILPVISLVKEKRISDIFKYLLTGLLVILPFLIRNVLISGYLLYPFDGIDIFNVEWKIPMEYLLVDANQIKVWGRCLYDVTKIDWPISQWYPVWREAMDRYEMMLFYGMVAGLAFLVINILHSFIRKTEYAADLLILSLGTVGSLCVWFFTAPFIRYGLAFIFTVIFIGIGVYFSNERKGLYGLLGGIFVFVLIICLTPYLDNYVKDDGMFVKQNIKEPYYVVQKDYDDAPTGSVTLNGNTIYYADNMDEINSYHFCPNTCYPPMLERSELMGERIKDGFRAK